MMRPTTIGNRIHTLRRDVQEIDKSILQAHFNAFSHGEKVRLGRILKRLGVESRGRSYVLHDIYDSILRQDTIELNVEGEEWDKN